MKRIFTLLAMLTCTGIACAETFTYEGDDSQGDLDGTLWQSPDPDTPLNRDGSYTQDSYTYSTVVVMDNDLPGNHVGEGMLYLNFIGEGAGQLTAGTQIDSATLSVYVVNDNGGASVEAYQLTNQLTEASTYNNYGSVSNNGVHSQTIFTEVFDQVVNTIDVTADVQEWLDGTMDNYGWGFSQDNDNAGRWLSVFDDGNSGDLNAIRPTLTIEYTIPEPATIGLLGICGTALILARRRAQR